MNPGREDGFFDEKTEQAVKDFQSKENLETTGVLTGDSTDKINGKAYVRKSKKMTLKFKKQLKCLKNKWQSNNEKLSLNGRVFCRLLPIYKC